MHKVIKLISTLHYNTLIYCIILSEVSTQAARPAEGYNVTSIAGLKSLGVRELGYKLAFLACSVAPASENKVRTKNTEGAMHI